MAVVLGTAGHIDHGKTSLVRALTGIDCDRLQEEKRRGITIELGFAWVDLPGGERLGIVDVPGHERFVKNMVAGAAGVDFVMLVIAADEGIMPQTREHLEICSLLGIRTGLVALTKTDMVDADWLEMVQEEVRGFLEGTFLDNAPTYLVFFNTAGGDATVLMTQLAPTLAAISAGAVFMGANTYIGNAPNLMVKAIAEDRGVKMPSFFGYMAWSVGILVPLFGLLTWLFFV